MNAGNPRLFVVAGERSGDGHGAALLRGLRERVPGVEIRGLGGPRMKAVAEGVVDWVEEAGVLGLSEVLKKYGWFRERMAETVDALGAWRADVVLFIDYPGFNLRLAKRLQKMRPETRLVYYVSPQVWAWNRGRIPRMAAMLDRMLCIFPFEKELYEASGLRTEFVGHPLVDDLAGLRADPPLREDGLIGWFPGSRLREVEKHLPAMLDAVQILGSAGHGVVSAASERVAEPIRQMIEARGLTDRVSVDGGDSRRLMQRCALGAVASGTATLEAALLGLPHCLVYRVAAATYLVGKMLVRVPHLGMANLLAKREIVPEFIQGGLRGEVLAQWVSDMRKDESRRETMVRELAEVRALLGGPGGHGRAAQAVAEVLRKQG